MKKVLTALPHPSILLFASVYLPMETFHWRLVKDIDDFIGLYDDWRVLSIPLAIALTALSLGFVKKSGFRLLLPGILYLLYYISVCFEVANAYRLAFGNTWLKKEVLFERVLSHGYFYQIGALGEGVFLISLSLIATQQQNRSSL